MNRDEQVTEAEKEQWMRLGYNPKPPVTSPRTKLGWKGGRAQLYLTLDRKQALIEAARRQNKEFQVFLDEMFDRAARL